jgi:hypothetical protein
MRPLLLILVLSFSCEAMAKSQARYFSVTQLPLAPRSAALGGSTGQERASLESAWGNPTGMVGMRGFDLLVGHTPWIGDSRLDSAGLGFGWGPGGIGLLYMENRTQYLSRDWEGSPIRKKECADGALGLNLSGRFFPVALGFGIKSLWKTMETYSSSALQLSFGTQSRIWDGRINVSAGYRDWTATQIRLIDFVSPSVAYTGFSVAVFPWVRLLEEVRYFTDVEELHSGTGLEFSGSLNDFRGALRMGFDTNQRHLGSLGGWTCGLGIGAGMYQVDYAFVPMGELGMTHRLGVKVETGVHEAWGQPDLGLRKRKRPTTAAMPEPPPEVAPELPFLSAETSTPTATLTPTQEVPALPVFDPIGTDTATSTPSPVPQSTPTPSVRTVAFLSAEAETAFAKQDWPAAETAYTALIESQPSAEAYYFRARARLRLGKQAEGIADFRQVLKLDPSRQDVKDIIKAKTGGK